MWADLLKTLLNTVLLPELTNFMEERKAKSLPPPTAEEIRVRMEARINRDIAEGEAFLRRKGVPIHGTNDQD